MKIAYDAKRFFNNASGLGNYSRDLIRILSAFYPKNDYILLNSKKSDRGTEVLLRKNVSFVDIGKGLLARQLKNGVKAQEIKADLYHGLSGELPFKWTDSKIKKIVTIHDLIFLRYPKYYSWFDRKIHYFKFKKAAIEADLITAISEQTKHDIVKYLKIPETKIRVVYQGCHNIFKSFISEQELAIVSAKFNLPEKFILSVGTVEPRKNLIGIIKALAQTDIPVVVVGRKDKRYFKKIKEYAKKGRVNIQYLDGVGTAELAALYRLAAMLVYPSHFEGFGIPVIEALFSGTAVITSNNSSLPEAGGLGALYVDPNSVEDLKAKIIFLWNNESERKRRINKGYSYVQNFTDEVIAKNMMQVYQEVIG